MYSKRREWSLASDNNKEARVTSYCTIEWNWSRTRTLCILCYSQSEKQHNDGENMRHVSAEAEDVHRHDDRCKTKNVGSCPFNWLAASELYHTITVQLNVCTYHYDVLA